MRTFCLIVMLAIAAMLVAQAPETMLTEPGASKAWAVTVGVSRYQQLPKEQWLEFADADAQSFSQYLLSAQGFALAPEKIITLTNDQATSTQIRSTLGTRLVRAIAAGDAVVVFLAMHGVVETEGARDAYVVGYDSSMENLFDTALRFADVKDILDSRLRKASRIVLIVDACRAGKLAETRTFHEHVPGAKRPEFFGLLASAPNESSVEGPMFGGGHGVFTYFLLRGLQGEADASGNGMVEWPEAARFVRDQVAAATSARQNPKEFGTTSPQLVVSLARAQRADLGFSTPPQPAFASLIVSGPPQTQVFLDGIARGTLPESGRLEIAQVPPQNHKLMLTTARGVRVVEEVQISSNPTEVEFNGTSVLVRPVRTRGLALPAQQQASAVVQQFRDALARRRLIEPAGESALDVVRRLPAAGAAPEVLQELTETLVAQLEDEGQQVILAYLKGDAVQLAAEDFERAGRWYAAAASLEPSPRLQARRAFCEGRARLYRGDFAAGIPLLEEATRQEPRGAIAWNAIGVARLQQNQPQQAIAPLNAAIERAPRWPYPLFNLALAYSALGQTARAEQSFQRAIQLGPRYAYLHYTLGGLYMRINQPVRAEQELRRALELDLDAAAGHNMLGNFFRSRTRDREAETEYRRALQFHAGDVPARLNLARLYRDQRQPRRSETELLEALKTVDAPAIRGALGDLYVEMRRPREAAAQYRRAAELAPDDTTRREYEQKARRAQP